MSEPADVGTGTATPEESIGALIVVSNRQPYRHRYEGDGTITVERPTGGLVAGLDPVLQQVGGTWVAWGDGAADAAVTDGDDTVAVPPEDPAYDLRRVTLEQSVVEGYYRGYANQALWPLCHRERDVVRYDPDHWEDYRRANARFAEAAGTAAAPGDTIWLQDYHLALAPARLAAETDAFLMHFWHIPWPPLAVFRDCPQGTALLEGLLGNDLLGFHLDSYGAHFLDCVAAMVPGATVDRAERRVQYNGSSTAVATHPLGVDVDAIDRAAATGTVPPAIIPDSPALLVLGVDRLDYTKGIVERLEGLEHLWASRPALRESITYLQKAEFSRQSIPAYQTLRERVESLVSRINGRFGTTDWQPVHFVTDHLDRPTLCRLYRDADACLVTPRRDGMNLVAQEFVAAQGEDPGVLVLSDTAGVHEHLGGHAISVTPTDRTGIARAVDRARAMAGSERRARMHRLQRTVQSLAIDKWMERVFTTVRRNRRARLA